MVCWHVRGRGAGATIVDWHTNAVGLARGGRTATDDQGPDAYATLIAAVGLAG